MEKEKVLFVYNPRAGKGTLRNKLADIIDMIVSVNANSPIAGDNGKHPGEDYIYRFSSIEFK